MNNNRPEKDLRLLAAGAIAGLVLAGFGILQQNPNSGGLPNDAVARINDTLITRELFDRALTRRPETYATSTGAPDGEVLQQLIAEELLVQRGLELGMTQSDLVVRQAIIDSLVASVTAEADSANPDDDELQQYLTANAERFSYTARIAIDAWQSDRESAAQAFVAALRADDKAPANSDVTAVSDLPDSLIPLEIAADYVGPNIAAAAAGMSNGGSAVFARRGRWLIIRLRDKERTAVTDLNTVRNRLLIDYRRNLADEMLRSYIDGLRQRADVTVAAP